MPMFLSSLLSLDFSGDTESEACSSFSQNLLYHTETVVAQSLTVQLCNPRDCSLPGFPVLHRNSTYGNKIGEGKSIEGLILSLGLSVLVSLCLWAVELSASLPVTLGETGMLEQ